MSRVVGGGMRSAILACLAFTGIATAPAWGAGEAGRRRCAQSPKLFSDSLRVLRQSFSGRHRPHPLSPTK